MLIARIGAAEPIGGSGFELQAIGSAVIGGASLFGGIGNPLGLSGRRTDAWRSSERTDTDEHSVLLAICRLRRGGDPCGICRPMDAKATMIERASRRAGASLTRTSISRSRRSASYPWLEPDRPEPLEGDLSPIRRDYLPVDYRRDMADLGVVKTVHVQNGRNPNDPLDETRWLSRHRRTGGHA